MSRTVFLLLLAGCVAAPAPSLNWGPSPAVPAPKPDPSDLFFSSDDVPELELVIPEASIQTLRADPRTYVRGTIRERGGAELADAAIKLKGAAGSFRGIDNRPAFTINVGKFVDGRSWNGLKKFHLNNSVQDESMACEYTASRLFQAAGIPAARTAHARVRLNGRDLGFYVLKEGFDTRFLRRNFGGDDGNLYDGGFCQDIGPHLERDEGEGPDEKKDLAALAAACHERNAARRKELLSRLVDIDKFITLMAMELMMSHWDGYTQNRNNYRIYFEPSTGKANFLPHGLDQVFQDPNYPILGYPKTLLASAVMPFPDWRRQYRYRIHELLILFEPLRVQAHVDRVARKLQPVLRAADPGLARRHADRIRELKGRIFARYSNLKMQDLQPDPWPTVFNAQGYVRLRNEWGPRVPENAGAEEFRTDGNRPALAIRGTQGTPFAASWRRQIVLGRGTYLLEASVMAIGIVPTRDPNGSGAGVRISGGRLVNRLTGSANWTTVEYEFTVEEEIRNVELVLELRAQSGQAWFDRTSLVLRKLK